MRIYPEEQVATIGDGYKETVSQIYATEEKDAQVSRVAVLLREFLKETQDPKRWDVRTSRAEIGGFMRAWARKIIEEVGR